MESHSTCLFVTGSFHLAFCPRGSSMLEYVSQFPSFFRLDSIQLSAYATFHFCIHPVMNIWVTSTSCPLWIMLLWTWECKYLFEGLLWILWEVGMLDHMVIMCLNFCGNAILFSIASQSSFTSLLDMKLEKAMAPHSSALAWEIPWTEKPGGLQSMGSLRVGHDWATSLSLFTFMHWRRKWQPTPVFLHGESQGRGSLVGCCQWGRTESDTTEATYHHLVCDADFQTFQSIMTWEAI